MATCTEQVGPTITPRGGGAVARDLETWHSGEREIQERIGVAGKMAEVGRHAIRDRLTEQHRNFFPLLPFIALGSVDRRGDPWATLRAGRPGFLDSPDERHLDLRIGRDWSDPAEDGLDDGDAVGVLGIELPTRRRNRLNGLVSRDRTDRFSVVVEQAFGNCPKYIQLRQPTFVREPDTELTTAAVTLPCLDASARRLIKAADTFFVATYIGAARDDRQMDVSHRGGKPGFVRIEPDDVLTIPDFAGNRFFNTLGNILSNPRVGLLFADFLTGDVLQLTGRGEVDLLSDPGLYRGAERLWRVYPDKIVWRRDALPVRFSTDGEGMSSNLNETGDWPVRLT